MRKKQKTIKQVFQSYEEILTNEAIAIILNNCPKSIVSNIYFRRAFSPKLNKKLLDEYIDKIYEDLKIKIVSALKQKSITIAFDSQTNPTTKDHIVNLILADGRNEYFQKSINIKLEPLTGDYLAKIIEESIVELEKLNILILGLCGDNASNNIKMSKIIQNKYPHIVYVNCAAHSVQLIIKDILKIYPLNEAFSASKKIVKLMLTKQNRKKLNDLQIAKNEKPIKILKYTETRQNSQLESMERLYLLKKYINLIDNDFATNEIQNSIEITINFLQPFKSVTREIEAKNSNNADVWKNMNKLKIFLENKSNDQYVSNVVKKIQIILAERWNSTFNNSIAITIAVLTRETSNIEDQKEAYNFIKTKGTKMIQKISNFGKKSISDEINTMLRLVEQFSDFTENRNPFDQIPNEATNKQFQAIAKYDKPELSILATNLLNISASEASVERSFSRQKRIQRPERSMLFQENMLKELFIQINFPTFEDANQIEKKLEFNSQISTSSTDIINENDSSDINDFDSD